VVVGCERQYKKSIKGTVTRIYVNRRPKEKKKPLKSFHAKIIVKKKNRCRQTQENKGKFDSDTSSKDALTKTCFS
jgi:hypothetical protein